MSTILRKHMDALIAQGVEFQVGLRSSPTPLGPAKVERITDHDSGNPDAADGSGYAEGLYRILVPAQMQVNKNARPQNVLCPVVFDAADLLVIIEAPINKDGDKLVHTPGNGNTRTAGGLVIPG